MTLVSEPIAALVFREIALILSALRSLLRVLMGDAAHRQPARQEIDETAGSQARSFKSGIELPLVLVRLRASASQDLQALNAMLLGSPSYKLLSQGRLPASDEGSKLLASLPVDAAREDKFLWCAWQQTQLVGCIEVIRHWPQHDTAYIGFALIREEHRRRGLGSQIFKTARQNIRSWRGVRRLRLAVVENNRGAIAFWRGVGFRDTGQRDRQADFAAPLIVMERPLA